MTLPRIEPLARGFLPVVACAAIVAGCGELGGDSRPKIRPIIVTTAEVAAQPAGSPQRAFMAWYRALQRKDARAASRLYVRSAGVTPATFATERAQSEYALKRLAPPRILSVVASGRAAQMRVRFREGGLLPNGHTRSYDSSAGTVDLRREDGRWKLSSNAFLMLLARERH